MKLVDCCLYLLYDIRISTQPLFRSDHKPSSPPVAARQLQQRRVRLLLGASADQSFPPRCCMHESRKASKQTCRQQRVVNTAVYQTHKTGIQPVLESTLSLAQGRPPYRVRVPWILIWPTSQMLRAPVAQGSTAVEQQDLEPCDLVLPASCSRCSPLSLCLSSFTAVAADAPLAEARPAPRQKKQKIKGINKTAGSPLSTLASFTRSQPRPQPPPPP